MSPCIQGELMAKGSWYVSTRRFRTVGISQLFGKVFPLDEIEFSTKRGSVWRVMSPRKMFKASQMLGHSKMQRLGLSLRNLFFSRQLNKPCSGTQRPRESGDIALHLQHDEIRRGRVI